MTTVEARLERLERSARRWRIGALTLAGALVVMVSCDPSAPTPVPRTSALAAAVGESGPAEVLQVRRLEVVNEGGRVLASFGIDELTSGGNLTILNGIESGFPKQHTTVNGYGLSISDDEHTSLTLHAVGPGSGTLSCPGRDGERTMIDASGLRVYRDHPRPDLDSLSPEEVRRLLADGDKELAVAIGTTDLGGGIISILNPLGEVVATVQSNKSNCGLIAAHDVNGDLKEALSGSR